MSGDNESGAPTSGVIAEFERALAQWKEGRKLSLDTAGSLWRKLRADPASLHTLRAKGGDYERFLDGLIKEAPKGIGEPVFILVAVLVAFILPTMTLGAREPESKTRGHLRQLDGRIARWPRSSTVAREINLARMDREEAAEKFKVPYKQYGYVRCDLEKTLLGQEIIAEGQGFTPSIKLKVKREVLDDYFLTTGEIGSEKGRFIVTIDTDSSCLVETYPKRLQEIMMRGGANPPEPAPPPPPPPPKKTLFEKCEISADRKSLTLRNRFRPEDGRLDRSFAPVTFKMVGGGYSIWEHDGRVDIKLTVDPLLKRQDAIVVIDKESGNCVFIPEGDGYQGPLR